MSAAGPVWQGKPPWAAHEGRASGEAGHGASAGAMRESAHYDRRIGRRLDRHGAGRIVRRVAHDAGIAKKVGPHALRPAFITAALDVGVPLRDVQEAASHADSRTTMRYDRARASLDRHVTYTVAAYIAGAARQDDQLHSLSRLSRPPSLAQRRAGNGFAFAASARQTVTVTSEQMAMISADPAVMHGQAVIAGTRVPVSVILDCIAAGMTTEQITAEYPTVTAVGVRAAAAYGAALAREELLPIPQSR